MKYKIIGMEFFSGHPFLILEINNKDAMICWEQKPTLFFSGFIFVQPEDVWSCILPVIDITMEDHFQMTLRSFIRSKTLIPIIIEMIDTKDVSTFNRKWSGKILTEELSQVTTFKIKDQLDHFTV
jgi:hypothetical protein